MKYKIWLANIAGVVIFACYVWYIVNNWDKLKPITTIPFEIFGAIVLCILLTWLLNSTQSYYLLNAQGIRIGFSEIFLLYSACTFVNYLPFRFGTILRFHYLKTAHSLTYTRAISVTSVRAVILIYSAGMLGLLGTLGVFWSHGHFSLQLIVFFSLMVILPTVAACCPLPRIYSAKNKFYNIWNDFVDGFGMLRSQPWITLKVMLVLFCQLICVALRFFFCFQVLDLQPSLFVLLLLAPVSVLTMLISLTPGGIGLREALMGYLTFATGSDFSDGIITGTIDRAMLLFVTLFVGSVGLIYLWCRYRKQTAVNL